MKKTIRMILSLVLVLVFGAALLVACNNKGGEEPETHTYSTTWSHDASEHWHQCTQEGHTDVADKAAHVYDKEVVADEYRASEATYTEPAKYFKSCVCGKKGTETFDNGEALGAKENQVLLADGVVLGKTYDGEAYTLSAEAFTKNGDGAITLEYKGAGATEWSSAAPVNAGSYEVRVSVASTAEWKAAQATFEFTIAKKQLTISGTTVADKVYDGSDTATVTAGTLAGLVSGDETSVGVMATGTFASKDVAYGLGVEEQDVTVSYALTGALANNYLAPVGETLSATINAKQLTISGTTVADKEYDGTVEAAVTAGTLAGLIGSDEVSVGVTATGTFASKNVAYSYYVEQQDVTIVYALTGALANNYIAPVGETLQAKINPKPLSNVHLEKVYDGHGGFARTALTTAQGIIAGESIKIYVDAIGANVGVYKDGNADEKFEFNEYVLYIGDTEEQTVNYAWGDTCTATIKAKQLTISGTTVADKVYDGTTDATVMTGTLAGLIGTDELSVGVSATGTFADKNAGSDKTVTIVYSLTGALANNYLAPKDETATATINKKELDLTEVPSREYNGDNRIQKLTSEGCVEGENVVVMYFLDSADAGDRTVTSCSFVAGYENYSIKSYSATATITQKVITEFNTTLTPQTGTSVSISASVDLDNGKTETVNFKFTVTSESVWNHAGELTLVLEKPLSTQVKIEIVDNPNYKLAYNFVGTLTIAESE